MVLVDSHAHLQDPQFDLDREAVLARAAQAGVEHIILPASDLDSLYRARAMAQADPQTFSYSLGIHPHEASSVDDALLEELDQLIDQGPVRPVAIGEVGLDYHYDHSPRQVQAEVFLAFMQMAHRHKLPLIIHSREASGDILQILQTARTGGYLAERPGVFHCYSGSLETAKILLDMGFYLGFDGPITFKNARRSLEVLTYCPLDRLLLETDSPYLAPVPMRGKRNEPAHLTYIAQQAASLKGLAVEELALATSANARELFELKWTK